MPVRKSEALTNGAGEVIGTVSLVSNGPDFLSVLVSVTVREAQAEETYQRLLAAAMTLPEVTEDER